MKTIVITYKGVMIKDPILQVGKRVGPGEIVTVPDGDAALLIGLGRAVPYEPPQEVPKEAPKPEPEKEPEREPVREAKKEGQNAPARSERRKE